MLVRQAGQLYPGGTGDPTSGRFILVSEEGTFTGPNDIYGYLFAPFVYRFSISLACGWSGALLVIDREALGMA